MAAIGVMRLAIARGEPSDPEYKIIPLELPDAVPIAPYDTVCPDAPHCGNEICAAFEICTGDAPRVHPAELRATGWRV